MNYYVINISKASDEVETKTIEGTDSQSEALGLFYDGLSKTITSGEAQSVLELLVSNSGTTLKSEKWAADNATVLIGEE